MPIPYPISGVVIVVSGCYNGEDSIRERTGQRCFDFSLAESNSIVGFFVTSIRHRCDIDATLVQQLR